MNKKTIFFILAVFLQLVLLLIIPIPRWLALTSGRTVVLETAPVDPYSAFRGYYVRLNYQISLGGNLPFAKSSIQPVEGSYYYVVLAPSANGIWEPQRILTRWPAKLKSNEVVLKGKYRNQWLMEYGIEQYYLPENQRLELEKLLSERNQRILVTTKVASGGQAAIVKLQVGRRSFEY